MTSQDFQTFKIYTRVADELQSTSPIVTYYLKTYTLNKAIEYLKMERSKGQDVSSRTQEIKEWLQELEKLKIIVNTDLTDREKCKLSYQTFAFTLFHESDRKFKSGELSRKLAKDFLYVSVLFDAWELVGVQSEQIKAKKTYSNEARFKIMDAINGDAKGGEPQRPQTAEKEKKGAAAKPTEEKEKQARGRSDTLDPLAKLNFDFTESIFIPKNTFDKLLEAVKPDVKIGFTNAQNPDPRTGTENNPNQINTNEPPKNRLNIPMGRSIKLAENSNDHPQQPQPNMHQHQQYPHPPYFQQNPHPNDSNHSNPQNQQQMYYQYPPPQNQFNGYYEMPPQHQQPLYNGGSGPQNYYNNNNNQNQNQGYLFPPVDYQNQPSLFYAPPRCLNSQNNLASLSQQQYQNGPYYDSKLAYGPGASAALQNYPQNNQNSTQFHSYPEPSQHYNPYQQNGASDQNTPYPQQYPAQQQSNTLQPQNPRGAAENQIKPNPYQESTQNSNATPIFPYNVTPGAGPESSGSSQPSNPYSLPQNETLQNSNSNSNSEPTFGMGASIKKQSSKLLKDLSVDSPQQSLKKSSNIFADNSRNETTNDTPTDPNPRSTSQKLNSTPGTPDKELLVNRETPQGTPEGDRKRPEITTPRETTPEITPEPSKQETEKKARMGKVISSGEAKNFCLMAATELDFNRLKEAKEKMQEALRIIEQLEMIQNH